MHAPLRSLRPLGLVLVASVAAPASAADAPTQRPAGQPAPVRVALPVTAPRPQQNGGADSVPSVPLAVQALRNVESAPPSQNGVPLANEGSLIAVPTPPPPSFAVHDLVTIVVNEQSKANSSAKTKTEKDYELNAEIGAWMNMDFSAWGEDNISLGSGELPEFAVSGNKNFEGKGDYKRNDTFTARITAEVIEVLPNGMLVLEAYKHIKNDDEEQTIRITGQCRPEDVDATNSLLSHRLANTSIEKTTKGQLRDGTEKGIVAKVLDAIFAF
jgi:flagellar L-ring protein precursor FlgH